ncbi:MAG: DUF302 domain-containing protein [Sulfurovaceae bacterium]
MKKIILSLVVMLLYSANADIYIFDINNTGGTVKAENIEKMFRDNGFEVGINNEMNRPFTKQFGKTEYKIFNLLTIYHPTLSTELVNKYPKSGVFVPMSIGIYQGANEKDIHISVLSAKAQEKITSVNSPIFAKIEDKITKAIMATFPHAKHRKTLQGAKATKPLLTMFEMKLGNNKPSDDKDNFEMSLESGFEPKGFVMPAFLNVSDEINKNKNLKNAYDFYDTYSICKLEVIYNVAKTRPEAAAFAPCTTIVYKKKGEKKLVVGFPSVYNWLSSASVVESEATRVLLKAQNDFETVLKDITE